MFSIFLICLIVHGGQNAAMNDDMKSFSHAIKGGYCNVGQEIVLFEHVGAGVITEQWYTGGHCMTDKTTVRYYIDGDATPTIEANLFMMHGIGFYDPKTPPWGTKWIGHLASGGGLYNKYRIPFQTSIRISYISQTSGYYWYIVRGVENYPVIIGDLKLPSNAKLVLHKIEQKILPPLTYVPLISTKNRGIVFSVAVAGESENFHWLEGCYGTVVTNSNKTTVNLLSSGTEDFFLSAYYYNKGVFHTDDAGLTYFKNPGTMSSYKFFSADPIIMSGSFSLLCRIGEVSNIGCWQDHSQVPLQEELKYLNSAEHVAVDSARPTKLTAYAWTYEW